MKKLKNNPLFSLLNSYLIDSSQPVNISYLWDFCYLLGICLIIQITTNTIFLTDGINIESLQSAPLFIQINSKLKQVINYINSFGCGCVCDFIKGIK